MFHQLISDHRGIENTEVAAIIALFVIIAIGAWQFFGNQLAGFVRGLPGKLGMGN